MGSLATSPPLRICAVRLPQEAAEKAVRRARKQVKNKGRAPDERTLFAAQFVLVITNLPAALWCTEQILDLYRVRWQIELFFKRLKSILFLDHLRARKAPLAKSYLLGKLLAACLLDSLTHHFIQSLPPDFYSTSHPLSFWTLMKLLWEQFLSIIRGPLSFETLMIIAPKLQPYLVSPPRNEGNNSL